MRFNLRWDVECAVRAALPSINRNLNYAGLEYVGSEDELITSLVEAIADQVVIQDNQKPKPLTRHEECSTWSDPGDEEGSWATHCTVCHEEWPCPEAGELDADEVSALQGRYLKLLAERESGADLNPFKHRDLRYIHRRLEAEGVLPSKD